MLSKSRKRNDMQEVVYDTPRYAVYEKDAKLVGYEKKHRVLKDDETVLVQKIGDDVKKSVAEALEKIGARKLISGGDSVAIKINLGGGIDGIPSSYTDPLIVEGIIDYLQGTGANPFVCEANMRTITMNEEKLRNRGYYEMLERKNTPFVNLSLGKTVEFYPLEFDFPLLLPEVLLNPKTKIISVAPPKHHWECGVTLAQKNMYGAIAERRKSIYHRHSYDMIDKVVAASARAMTPDLSVVGARKLCTGLGPHFCIPINFNYLVVAPDMLRCDMAASEILGYPYTKVKYAMLNAQGIPIAYRLHRDSVEVDAETKKKIMKNAMTQEQTGFWKALLYEQYFIPHWFQYNVIARFEFLATYINKKFYEPKGDQ